ncbi:MAG: hypothetical protein GKC08_02990 [Methanosarcinales archaeon]|nr:hypothetical protein [Methanosarcinales archaeon]
MKKEEKKKDEKKNSGCLKPTVALLAILTLTLGSVACTYINKKLGLADDNAIEESVEAVIQNQLGIDVDLTPSSPEHAAKT